MKGINVENIIQQEPLFYDQEIVQIEPLGGGQVNHAYKISTDEEAYFIRINSAQYQHLNLNFPQEFQALSVASKKQIAPKLVAYNEERGYLINEFLPSEKVEIQELRYIR